MQSLTRILEIQDISNFKVCLEFYFDVFMGLIITNVEALEIATKDISRKHGLSTFR